MKRYCKVKIFCRIACFISTLVFQGCISFSTGPECSFSESITKYQLSVQSVTSVRAKVERVPYSSGHGYYKLNLVADGRFVRHEGHSRKVGTPCMSIGLWPGFADNKGRGGFVIFGSIFGNYILAGIPTLVSLLVEPLCDYHERESDGGSCIAEYGLIGFNKYYRDTRKDQSRGFDTVSTTNLSSYELFGYTVMIDGQRYEDKDYGQGCSGVVYFTTTRPSGSRISIRIIEAPSSRSDGNDGFSGMEGMEIAATLP